MAAEAHQRAEVFQENMNWPEAIAAYEQAIEHNSQFSWSHHNLGICYQALGQWSPAANAYRNAIELNPGFVWSHYNLAEALGHLGQWNEAAHSYRQVLQLDPENIQVPPRLVEVLRMLLQQEPRNIDYYIELAQQLMAQNKPDEGIAAYQIALQIAPSDHDLAVKIAEQIRSYDPHLSNSLIKRVTSQNSFFGTVEKPEDLRNLAVAKSVLMQSHLFDPTYYRMAYPSVQKEIGDLLDHYLHVGSQLGYRPNPLFDAQYYQDQCSEVATLGINPLAHYFRFGYQEGYNPHPYFCDDFYLTTHPEVAAAGLNPLEHYLAYGAHEGRAAFSVANSQKVLKTPIPDTAKFLKCWQYQSPTPLNSVSIGVYCNSQGNYFIEEIADFIADALTQAGHDVLRLSEEDEVPATLDYHWVVAPHEFFYLGQGHQWAQKRDWLSNVVMVNVEQPQTTWFSKAFYFMRHAPIIFDINVKSTEMLQNFGLPAYWLPLGYLEDYKPFDLHETLPDLLALRSLPPQICQKLPDINAPLAERPLDVHFIGTLNPRREHFFATNAYWLSQYQNFFHIPPMGVPLLKGEDQALDTPAVVGLSRRCKILLNIHRDELPYFEWHRLVFHGLWQNTLVVTEPCHKIPGLVAGQHFIECCLSEMEETIHWLLTSSEGQETAERVRRAGYQMLQEQFDGAAVMTQALDLVSQSLRTIGD